MSEVPAPTVTAAPPLVDLRSEVRCEGEAENVGAAAEVDLLPTTFPAYIEHVVARPE